MQVSEKIDASLIQEIINCMLYNNDDVKERFLMEIKHSVDSYKPKKLINYNIKEFKNEEQI